MDTTISSYNKGPYTSSMKIDMSTKGAGKSPIFSMRIAPELKEQFEKVAAQEGLSLANWLKALAKTELQKHGIKPIE